MICNLSLLSCCSPLKCWQSVCILTLMSCCAAYIVWSYSTSGRKGLQIGLLLVPRLLIQLLAAVTTASFLGWLLFFKDEPAEWRLKQFLKPEQYPTVRHLDAAAAQTMQVCPVFAQQPITQSGDVTLWHKLIRSCCFSTSIVQWQLWWFE